MLKINNFLKDWTMFERVWLASFTVVVFILYFAWSDSVIGLISSLAGMLSVVLVAKGKISNYFFGIISVSLYGYISYGYGLYGEVALNWGFYLTANIVGYFMWLKNAKEKSESQQGEDITAKRLTKKGWAIVTGLFIAGTLLTINILNNFNAQQVPIDSVILVLSIIAQILMLYRYAEQWILWIIINVLTITLWLITLIQTGGNDWTMVVMWSAYLINSIYGYIVWLKLSK